MDCKSQPESLQPDDGLKVVSDTIKGDNAWLQNLFTVTEMNFNFIAFDNIESQTIERIYNKYLASNGEKQYRLVVLGISTVDLKKMLLILTDDPDDESSHRQVLRSQTHKRPRSDPENSRFGSPIVIGQDLELRDMKENHKNSDEIHNWLGMMWGKQNYKDPTRLPPLKKIQEGLMIEAMVQLRIDMELVQKAEAHREAAKNILQTWKNLLSKAQVADKNEQLSKAVLCDPTHSVTNILLYIYTIQGWLYATLNKASRFADYSKILTLGPYSQALDKILSGQTSRVRRDINPKEYSSCELFRGTGLSEKYIQEFRQLALQNGTMRLFGFTSTSKDRQQAENFAFKNDDLGIKKVLYQIQWNDSKHYYVLTMSAFAYEQEVLLIDGKKFKVLGVSQSKDHKNEDIVVISLKNCS